MATLKAGDKARVTRTRIAKDGTSEQVADWAGTAVGVHYEDGRVAGVELPGVGWLDTAECSLGREGTMRTVVERIEDEAPHGLNCACGCEGRHGGGSAE